MPDTSQPTPEAAKAALDQFDLKDPGQPDLAAKPEPKGEPAVAEAAPEPIAGATVETFPDHLLRRAIESGISVEEARTYGSPKALESALGHIQRARQQAWQQQQQWLQQQRQQAPPPKPAPQAQDEPIELTAWDTEHYGEEFIRDIAVRDKFLRRQQEQLQRQAQELQQIKVQMQQSAQAEVSRRAQEADQTVERLFQEAEEYQDIFGQGGRYQLSESSPEFAARRAICQEMNVLYQGYIAQRMTPPPTEELFGRAVRMLHGDRGEKKLADRLRNRAGQFVAAPGGRRTAGDSQAADNMTDEERTALAVRNVRRFQRERGMNGEE